MLSESPYGSDAINQVGALSVVFDPMASSQDCPPLLERTPITSLGWGRRRYILKFFGHE